MGEQRVAVHVSKDLYNEVKCRVKESGGEFKSVGGYVEFILREVVKEENKEGEKRMFTQEEEKEIMKKLKRLGYL